MLYSEKKYDISELVLKSILRQEKIENLQITFEDDRKKALEKRFKAERFYLKIKRIKKNKKRQFIKN